jgi:hypothetical protein
VSEKRRFAHFVIDGSLPFEGTDQQTDELAERLRAMAASPPPPVALAPARALAALEHGPQNGPRGLSPAGLLEQIVDSGGLEVDRIAARLVPRAQGPWYRAASAAAAGPEPATLSVPVGLWALARGGDDPDYAASVAATVARLTSREPRAIADATLLTLALTAGAVGGLQEVRRRWAGHARLAERWGGAPPSRLGEDVLQAALRHPADPAATRAAAPDPVGPLAGALVGISTG